MVFGCLKRGVGVSHAAGELNAVVTLIHRENPTLAKDAQAPLLLERVRGVPNPVSRHKAMPVVLLLMAVVALVLLIACMNVGTLLVARGMSRQREIAVRFALGADRGRVLRQLMTENLALGVLGGAAGVFVGYTTNRLLVAALPKLPSGEVFRIDLPLDFRVLLYMGSVALLTVLLFGLLPALQSSRGDLAIVLKGVNMLSRGGNPLFSYPEYRALRERNQSLDGLSISEPEESDLSFEGDAILIGAEPVSG